VCCKSQEGQVEEERRFSRHLCFEIEPRAKDVTPFRATVENKKPRRWLRQCQRREEMFESRCDRRGSGCRVRCDRTRTTRFKRRLGFAKRKPLLLTARHGRQQRSSGSRDNNDCLARAGPRTTNYECASAGSCHGSSGASIKLRGASETGNVILSLEDEDPDPWLS